MGKPTRRRNNTAKNKAYHKIMKTKRFVKHNDQRFEDLKPENVERVTNQPIDEDLPGLGQFYCVHCAKYFVTKVAQETHDRTRQHKKLVKELQTKPYDLREAAQLNKY